MQAFLIALGVLWAGPPAAAVLAPVTTSPVAALLSFEFDGELIGAKRTNLEGQVRAQLLYTVGHMNGVPGVSRLDHLRLSHIVAEPHPSGLHRIRYHAVLPIAWGHKDRWPTTYPLTLPRRMDPAGQEAFTQRYASKCKDEDDDDHHVTVHNYRCCDRTHRPRCRLGADDVVTFPAVVSVSSEYGRQQYPDYDRVWADNALEVVVIFGKYTPQGGATDDGVGSFNDFVKAVQAMLPRAIVTPGHLPPRPGPAHRDITFQQQLPDGSRISVVVLLVDDIKDTPPWFDKRYAELTPGADLIVYSGHAGLGKNIRVLSEKGQFFPGKYQIFLLDGCDTFAYGDGTLVGRRQDINPDDPDGTKYLDLVANAMPSFFDVSTTAPMAILRGLMHRDEIKSYSQLLREVDPNQIIMVTGNQDKTQPPARHGPWDGFELIGTVKRGQNIEKATPVLPEGKYVFVMTPDAAQSGGDADLRLRVGGAPSASHAFRCPSYGATSNARCTVTLDEPAKVFVSVSGVGAEARFLLRGYRR